MKCLLSICLILSSLMAQAHQADISTTMLVEQENGSWILQVRAALTAFEFEVHTHFGKDSYDTPEKFQQLVISHVQENLSIVFDEKKQITLNNPFVKLGHETNVIFEVMEVPQSFKSISIKNSSFKDINRNQSALIILKKGFSKEQFILNNENNHQIKLRAIDSKFVAESNSTVESTGLNRYLLMGGLFSVVLILFFIKRKNKS